MQKFFALVSCMLVLLVSPVSLADEVEYLDDAKIKRSIERQGTALIEAGKTVENATLQQQLAERRQYDAAAPAEVELPIGENGVYEQVDDGVLVIAGLYLCGRCDDYHANCATGFVISEDGLAITNHHVVSNDRNTTMVAMTRSGKVVPIVEVLASNEADDIALIRLGGEGFSPVPIARSARVGERVHAVTHPNGRFFYYSSGEVSRFFMQRRARNQPPVKRIGISADYAKGSSGGPIFNDAGQVVGVVCSTSSVYYNTENGNPRNLQLVFHDCVPYESILALFASDAEARGLDDEQADAN